MRVKERDDRRKIFLQTVTKMINTRDSCFVLSNRAKTEMLSYEK